MQRCFFKVINQPYDASFPWHADVDILREFELKDNAFKAKDILYKTRGNISFLKISPNSRAVAFIESSPVKKKENLFVLNLSSKKTLKVSDEVSASVDWLPDNKNLVYIEKRLDDQGRLTKSNVISKDGTLVKIANKLLLGPYKFPG